MHDIERPVCIVGLGLIGGSLLRDLEARGQDVFGFNRSTSAARAAVKQGYDVSDDLDAVLRKAEARGALIVVAVPMHAVGSILDRVAELAPTCGITDVVSVKTHVLHMVRERGLEARYVGGHPMAGTSESGWENSRRDLFHRTAWAITFDYAQELDERGERIPKSWMDVFTAVTRMAKLTGAEVVPVRVEAHDAAVARISHLPHVMAEVLAVVGDHGGILSQSLSAGSFKDATRVAGTDPSLVRQMLEPNAPALVEALDEALSLLVDARARLASDSPDVSELTDAGYRARTRLEARSGARKESVSPVKISSRPVIRLQMGAPRWVTQLRQAESLGGRIEIF